MIQLRTLGTLDLRNSQGSELRHVITQPRRLALLAWLAAASPRGFHRRDTLLALFWADLPVERARASLSRAVYFLRQELGPGVLISRGDEEIGLDPERFWCDAVAFEGELQRHRLHDGLALYRGDLLPGFFAPDAKGFEEWLEQERARLRERASAAAWDLAAHEEQAGSREQAVQWARWGVDRSPFSEIALQRLLMLLDRTGDRSGANRAYQEFAGRIAGELDLMPSPETQALIASIRARDHAARLTLPIAANPDHQSEAIEGSTAADAVPERPLRAARPGWARPIIFAGVAVAGLAAMSFARAFWSPAVPNQVYVAPFVLHDNDQSLSEQGRLAADRVVESLAATGLVEVTADRSSGRRAGFAVHGNVSRENGWIRFEARINDARTGRIVWTIRSAPVVPDSSAAAVDELSRRVAGGVVALATPRFASWFPVATSPPTVEAFLEFAQADQLQLRGADRAALPHLERAVALDPVFAWAELQLIAAHLSLFDSERANPLIEAQSLKRDRLNLLQRHWLDWMRAVKAEDLTGGYDAISAAARLAPERFLYDRARWATFLNRPRETIEVLEQLGPDSPYNGGTAGYWRLLTRSYHALEDFEGELAAARRARRSPVAPIVALSFECIALAGLGKIEAIRARLDTTLTLPLDPGTSPRQLMAESGTSPAQVMVLVAEELRAHGHEASAEATLARAWAWYAGQPPDAATDRFRRFDLGMAAYYARDWVRADSIFRTLVADDPGNFVYLGRLGTVAARRGDEPAARDILRRFDDLRLTLPMPHNSAGFWQSKITMLLGDEQRAMALMTESVGPQGRGGMHADFDFERIWGTRLFRDFVRPKG